MFLRCTTREGTRGSGFGMFHGRMERGLAGFLNELGKRLGEEKEREDGTCRSAATTKQLGKGKRKGGIHMPYRKGKRRRLQALIKRGKRRKWQELTGIQRPSPEVECSKKVPAELDGRRKLMDAMGQKEGRTVFIALV